MCKNFADECDPSAGTEQGMVSSLAALMGVARVLQKPRGGKKAARAARNLVERYSQAVQDNEISSFLGGTDRRDPRKLESLKKPWTKVQ